MVSLKFLWNILIPLSLLFACDLFAQGNSVLKNGIYLTWEELKNNTPSIKASLIKPVDGTIPEKSFCTDVLWYLENRFEKHVRSNAVWGLHMNGKFYIRFFAEDWNPITSNNCFFQLFGIEALSKFFVVEGDLALNSVIKRKSKPSFREYILDFKSGKTYDLNKNLKRIIKIIKSDPSLNRERITRKNIHLYIAKYNKSNPVFRSD